MFIPSPRQQAVQNPLISQPRPAPTPPASVSNGANIGVSYYADMGGCGHWRLMWPEEILNVTGRATVYGLTRMVLDKKFYKDISLIRIQRQATEHQLKFVKYLKEIQPECGFRIVYEVDDVVFTESIPDYNKYKESYLDPSIERNVREMMNLADEVTVSTLYLKNFFREKIGKREITTIPNFIPKFVWGNLFDHSRVCKMYDKNQKRPRILYAGSAAHFDEKNKADQKDDFEGLTDYIIKTRKKYEWIFYGGKPEALDPYIKTGEIVHKQWKSIYDYTHDMKAFDAQATIAPLQDNDFNRSKSDIKILEAAALGIPCICQDVETYKNADFKFNNAEQLDSHLTALFTTPGKYKAYSAKTQKIVNERWLENEENIGAFWDLYRYPYGDPRRKHIAKHDL